jgi:CMP/dCMP kinase
MKTLSPLLITISRQLGSGGAAIGQQLAKRLNIQYIDREIISMAAQQLSVLEQELDERDEKMQSFWQSFFQFNALAANAPLPPDMRITTMGEVFRVETDIIQRIAKEQSAVIMGRCGFHILHDQPKLVSIYLHADLSFRIERIARHYGIGEEEAQAMIAKNDKERRQYIETFTGNKWCDARQFNLCVDTGKTGIANAVDLILAYTKVVHPA